MADLEELSVTADLLVGGVDDIFELASLSSQRVRLYGTLFEVAFLVLSAAAIGTTIQQQLFSN